MTTFVLVVGVEPILSQFLTEKGFAVTVSESASLGHIYELLAIGTYHALVVGPETHFHADAAEQLRAKGYRLAIVLLENGPRTRAWSYRSARFIEAGGDNVVLTPCCHEEVFRCVEVAIRHAEVPPVEILRFEAGGSTLEINERRKTVTVDGLIIHLTSREYGVLFLLAKTRSVVSSETLATEIQDDSEARLDSNRICVFVHRVRKKIGRAVNIVTRRGIGYELLATAP